MNIPPEAKTEMRKFTDLFYGRGATKFATNESFQLLLQSWSILGHKSIKPFRLGHLLHMCFCWFFIIMCPVFFFMGYLQALKTEPIMIQLSILQAEINIIGIPLKSIVITIFKTHLRSAEPIFARLDERYQSTEDNERIKITVVTSTRLFITIGFVYQFYGTIIIRLPYADYIPQPTIRYWSNFMFGVFHFYFLLSVQSANDAFPAIYIRTLRTHINLLTQRVSQLGENPEFTDEQNYDELVDCIVTHQELLKAKNIIGSVCSKTLFIQFVIVAMAHCISLLNFFVFADDLQRVITFSYYLCVMMQIMPTCYQASMLVDDSSKLPDAIFHCNWLAMDKRCRKLIIYFLHRAQTNITFVALKLFKIDMTTNLSIFKFAFSLYTFMNNMGFGQNIKELLE